MVISFIDISFYTGIPEINNMFKMFLLNHKQKLKPSKLKNFTHHFGEDKNNR